MSATTNDVKPVDNEEKNDCRQEDTDLIHELVEACREALKLRSLECSILTKKGLLPYERQKYRDEAAAIERKIRSAIAKANPKA